MSLNLHQRGNLFCNILINCFPTRVYGQMEYYLSFLKFITIILIVVLGLAIDLGASPQGRLGFRYWKERPFPDKYLGTTGTSGHFLGFWAVIMQASFSFSGSEFPGIAAGEVIDATRNVPRALRKVWIRITLFYLGGVLVSGLLVPYDDPFLALGESPGHQNGHASPFVIAFTRAGWKLMPNVVNAAILLSALSAASSDIYISSRFLFFLARHILELVCLARSPNTENYPQNQILTAMKPLTETLVTRTLGLRNQPSYLIRLPGNKYYLRPR
ncbi:hypothetical protein DICSQDRAFT_130608 [Dichomitus squalens LYAD-421 SS1]|uniref:Amino acid permease/ SLC12A domain-containing protein n=1 Tax=Dichomitus squalens (strain LYAD-421) TaxID=732165 RepID=R7SHS4_DICSQ|nr:uncharacterized protein DICSQDRAFT_130608 [Dichomitus squalens LYAD-421 SS1]EJF55433.1 hypothetical protein DICSQDRAFT_130608 [Dichomitus squalens LYAD-421 SS1]